jgi:ankyrin repeat protein
MAPDQAFLDAFLDACWAGELPKTQEAIASGQLTVEDLDEGLALATEGAHPDIVAALFDAGAPVKASTVDLLPVPQQQHPSIVRQFLEHGLDPNARLSNGEPLLGALADPACARELLSRGADPNVCDPDGKTPLFRAIQSSKTENTSLLELLLEHGAKLEPDLLFAAVAPRVRHQELMTKFLLAKGLDPNTTNAEWGTPLHLAVYAVRPNIVKLLLDAGADPLTRATSRRFPGESPLQLAQTQGHRHPEITQTMLNLLQQGL